MSQVVQAAKICKCAAHVSAVVVVIVALVVSCRHVALCPTQGVQVGIRVSGGGCACLFPQPSAGQQVGDRVSGGACACFLPSAGQQVGDCVSGGACACLFPQLFAVQKRTHTTPTTTTTITTATNAAPNLPPPTPLPAYRHQRRSHPTATNAAPSLPPPKPLPAYRHQRRSQPATSQCHLDRKPLILPQCQSHTSSSS